MKRKLVALSGLAAMVEVHYTTNLNSPGSASGTGGDTEVEFGSGGSVDVLNLTVGVDIELGRKTLFRVAGVVPLSGSDDSFFDSEIQVLMQYNF